MKGKSYSKAITAAIVTQIFWGLSFLASSIGQESASPFVLMSYRFDIALLALTVPVLLGKQKLDLRGKSIKPLLLLGAMEPCIYFIGEQYGLKYSSSAFSGIMIAVIPIVTIIFAAVFLKERPSKKQWLFSALSIAGIIVITLAENSGGSITFKGFALLCLAVVTGSAFSVISCSVSGRFSVFERTYFMQAMGAVFFTTLALIENGGSAAARRVRAVLAEAETVCYAVPRLEEAGFLPLAKDIYRERFSSMDALIFIGACGIAVREIAPYLVSKKTDPAVLCIDEKMQFVIPLLSGHIGGANDLARRLAAALGAAAVITTATDVNGKFAVDAWAAKNECAISSMLLAKKVAAEILEHDVPLVSDFPIKGALPGGIVEKTQGALGIVIGYCTKEPFAETLRLTPRVLRVGIGCRMGTAQKTIEAAVAAVLSAHQLDPSAVKGVYSIDLKQQEAGLLAACAKHNWPTVFYTAEELRSVPGEFTDSPFVQEITGVGNVCERAAMRGAEKLLVKKTAVDGVTVAVAAEHWEVTFG